MTTALRIENVSKMYRLGQVGSGTLSHDLNRVWARLLGREDPMARVGVVNDRTSGNGDDVVWALRDINFEVQAGEIIGIIGRNGAGKSTLLKLLSRVTGPTEGHIYINGRIASLLEVGTGFHPELTGLENIYLNGAILGMTRREIRAQIEEIVEFSGCAKYIDTPVKRYSSGMMVRLAFAVAAHLNTDIVIVDEVLAVGDAEFQQRCLGKMQDMSRKAHRTVLFVSHNMAAVRQLCPRSILMDKGTVVNSGETGAIIEEYMSLGSEADRVVTWEGTARPQSRELALDEIRITSAKGDTETHLTSSDDVHLEISYSILCAVRDMRVGFALLDGSGTEVFLSSDYFEAGSGKVRNAGCYISKAIIPGKLLLPGRYLVEVHIEIPKIENPIEGVSCGFEIEEMTHDCWGPINAAKLPGAVHPCLDWTITRKIKGKDEYGY